MPVDDEQAGFEEDEDEDGDGDESDERAEDQVAEFACATEAVDRDWRPSMRDMIQVMSATARKAAVSVTKT